MSNEPLCNPYRYGRTREAVMRAALKWMAIQRRVKIIAVLGRDSDDAERAYAEITVALREAHRDTDASAIAAFQATYPPGKRRFEFDNHFNTAMLRATGRDPDSEPAVWDDLRSSAWGSGSKPMWKSPETVVIGRADALAREGRTQGHAEWCAGMLRNIVRATAVRLVLVGTIEIDEVMKKGGLLRRS